MSSVVLRRGPRTPAASPSPAKRLTASKCRLIKRILLLADFVSFIQRDQYLFTSIALDYLVYKATKLLVCLIWRAWCSRQDLGLPSFSIVQVLNIDDGINFSYKAGEKYY